MAYDLKHRTTKTVARGVNYPLGAALTSDGVNFAVYSKHATEVFLLLFDKPDGEPTDIIQLSNRDKCMGENGADLGVERLFFILNSHFDPQWVNLPPLAPGGVWRRAIDTSLPSGDDFTEPGREISIDPSDHYIANSRSTVVLLSQKLSSSPHSGVERSEQSIANARK
jgi:pullulanase/glycogen debranching enzyme